MNRHALQTGQAGRVMTGLRRRRNPAMGLRMTAMIDVIFLLLTFFVLTARFKQPESHLTITMPKPAAGIANPNAKEPLTIRLRAADSACGVLLPGLPEIDLQHNTIEANLTDLDNQLQGILPSYDIAGQGIELYCEDDVSWDYVVKVYDVLHRAGAAKITFVTEEKTTPAGDAIKNMLSQ